MRTIEPLVTLLLVGILGVVGSGCMAETGAGPAPPLDATSTSSATSPTPVEPGNGSQTSRTTRPTSATEKLLLPEQVQLQEGGDGLGPSCDTDGQPPVGFRRDPGVWLNTLYSPTEYPYIVVLCLRGFRPDAPIDVRLSTGGFAATTHVMPRSGTPETDSPLGYEEEPSTTLFDDGADLSIYATDDGPPGAFVTEMWTFYPPDAARDAIADSGAIELSAVQDDLTAQIEQPIPVPTTRSYYRLSNTEGDGERLVLVGYPEGADVPIGLYRRTTGSPEASLVDELGTVTVPRSRLVSYAIPDNIVSDRPPGTYCLVPPVDQDTGCESFRNWPPYPGKISGGDQGDRVRAWQEILIGAGVLPDRPENRDGVYGPATDAAISRFLTAHDWSPLDGEGVLGRQMYDLLTG